MRGAVLGTPHTLELVDVLADLHIRERVTGNG
jgi:hypothetical protein